MAKILDLVENSSTARKPSQKHFITKFATVLYPRRLVLCRALALAALLPGSSSWV